ncbi:MAG TPA: DNA polymerase III subunit alpha, partial [Oceanithermus sp.]|nr:DNA polymerase III subunit alpha [Oceanithermus sp.]
SGLFEEASEPRLPSVPPIPEVERLKMEKEALGIYVTGHPLRHYEGLAEVATVTIAELARYYEAQSEGRRRIKLVLAGMVEDVARKPTKSGGMMAKFQLADETGAIEVVAFGRAYERVSPRLKEDAPVAVVATVEPDADGESLRVVAEDLYLWEELEGLPKVLELELELDALSEERMLELRSLLDAHPGTAPLRLRVRGPGGRALLLARGVRVDEGVLPELARAGVGARFVPDVEALLAARRDAEGGEEAVPF